MYSRSTHSIPYFVASAPWKANQRVSFLLHFSKEKEHHLKRLYAILQSITFTISCFLIYKAKIKSKITVIRAQWEFSLPFSWKLTLQEVKTASFRFFLRATQVQSAVFHSFFFWIGWTVLFQLLAPFLLIKVLLTFFSQPVAESSDLITRSCSSV